MPVQIGAQSHSFSDPTGLLSDCHRRIEMFLGTLERVASVIDRPLANDTRPALESALRYFREAAPKHTADEEESLFPRLRQVHLPDVEGAIERLELLEQDHVLAGSLHAEVEALGQWCLATGCLESTNAEAFRKAIATLVALYKKHINVEDNFVFPLAARLLSSTDKAAIANEMAARRG
jgi:hemerythrin-like domain-containing protein